VRKVWTADSLIKTPKGFVQKQVHAFRLSTKKPGRRTDVVAAGHLLAVDPQSGFAIEAPDVIMIPLTGAVAQVSD